MSADGTNQVNPYAPPSSDLNDGGQPPAVAEELAERGTRLAARMVDGFIATALLLPGIIGGLQAGRLAGGRTLDFFRSFATTRIGMFSGVAWLALIGFQAYLISTTGQSIGKRWLRIRIVKVDGRPVDFLTGVLLRQWLFGVLAYLPGFGAVAGLADQLFIFRADRRCAHDFLAGTKVIRSVLLAHQR